MVRPRRVIQVPKLWIDITGKFNVESLQHHFQYLMGACTDIGFLLIEGLTYKSQSLFVIARIFNDLGGPPAVVQVDGAGEPRSSSSPAREPGVIQLPPVSTGNTDALNAVGAFSCL